jgi:transposase InsO family protein
LALAPACAALGISRATLYRQRGASAKADTGVRDTIQRIALEMPCYGYRRITAELRRRSFKINHKAVLRLMREDNLLCLRRKRAFVVTTDARHTQPVYPNLARDLRPDSINQLWVADITYIRLAHEFIYLAVILDAFSRRVIGWALERYLDAELTLQALRLALRTREMTPGLVHHSDRGVQYACADYIELLIKSGIRISMSRAANPYDNAQCERFMRTLKYEEVYLSDYDTLAEARRSIKHFLERVSDELCKRVSVQRRHAAFKDDGEGLHRLTPMRDGHRPLFRDVTQG